MKEELKRLARHRLDRFYYSAFYAARALLATREVDSSKHSGVIALFQRHFVTSGLVNAEIGRTLARVFAKRQKTDYGDFATVTAGEARQLRDEVRAFVEECERATERLAAEET